MARHRIDLYVFLFLLTFTYAAFSDTGGDGLTIIKSNESELILSYSPKLLGLQKITLPDGNTAIDPVVAFANHSESRPGYPNELVFVRNITVPGSDGFKIERLDIEGTKEFQGYITPVGDFITGSMNINFPAYASQTPNTWASIEYQGIARDRYIAAVKFIAARYNPQKNVIEVPGKITLRISFNSKLPTVKNKNISAEYKIFSGTINHNQTLGWVIPQIDENIFAKKPSFLTSLSSGNWLKVSITQEGIYKITASQISGAGFSINASEAATIKIFGKGGRNLDEKVSNALMNQMDEQEIIVRTKENGDLDYILFYARPANGFAYNGSDFYHYINHYSKINYYLLTWGGDNGKRAEPMAPPSGDVQNNPITYNQNIFYEDELYNAFPSPGSGRMWYGRNIFPWDNTNILHNLDPNGTIDYKFSVAHRTNSTGSFTIKESDNVLTRINLAVVTPPYDGSYRNKGQASLPASRISDDRSVLKFEYSSPAGVAGIGYLDWYEISYPRYFTSIDNEISFFSDPSLEGITEFSINELMGSEIIGFETTNINNPHLLKNLANTGGMFIFRTKLEKDSPKAFYISSKFLTPQLEKTDFGDLRGNIANADVILITHPDLVASAEAYKAYRESVSGLKVFIARTDYIYNEFASGIPDPTALRDYIAYACSVWDRKPTYVILWGDGHYDYKNIGTDKINFVPPYESEDDTNALSALNSYTTDDYLARIIGDDKVNDIAIGRITIDSDKSGEAYIQKLKEYEKTSSKDIWRTMITLVADDSQSGDRLDGNTHTRQSETLANSYLPDYIQQKKIYLPDYPTENVPGGKRKPRVTEELLTTVNTRGTLLLNWIGHGNPRVWAHEEILERNITIPQMNNFNKLFFVTAATCDYARFDDPEVRSGAEEMLLKPDGAAIGVFSSARVVFSNRNAEINQFLYQNLFSFDTLTSVYPTLGEAMYRVKSLYHNDNDEKFYLLGDPTLRLLIPPSFVKIETINGVAPADSDTLVLKALSRVEIKGSIWKNINTRDSDFNGTAIVTMLDGDEPVTLEDTDGSLHYILKHGGALNQSSYKVTNGEFKASFIIPKDISFSKKLGRFYAYAYTADEKFAKGSDRSFRIEGIEESPAPDAKGPDINIYLDSKFFQPCELVRPTPTLIVELFDASGINTTGRGIGHKIEAWIDDNPTSIDLTSNFVTSAENSNSGSAEKILFDLAPGRHTVRVRAWDVYNNFSTAETCFMIGSKGDIELYGSFAYPNPTNASVTVRFNHNINPPFDASLSVYSVEGSLLREVTAIVNSAHTSEISWDGLDMSGSSISTGTYFYVVKAFIEGSGIFTVHGMLSVIK